MWMIRPVNSFMASKRHKKKKKSYIETCLTVMQTIAIFKIVLIGQTAEKITTYAFSAKVALQINANMLKHQKQMCFLPRVWRRWPSWDAFLQRWHNFSSPYSRRAEVPSLGTTNTHAAPIGQTCSRAHTAALRDFNTGCQVEILYKNSTGFTLQFKNVGLVNTLNCKLQFLFILLS